MKAKYVGKCRDGNGVAVHLFYSYRGHEYMITDEHNGYSETIAEKHRYEQDKIDRLIDEKQKAPSNNNGDFDINEIYSLMGWN